tara:strand:- start:44 stop:283 length:240 start_codon:yes stop_codon:yes gene_type:complete
MFVILATKPLNDGTKGFRFHFGIRINGKILGKKGIYRKRSTVNRQGKSIGDIMNGYHFGKRSVYFEQTTPKRKLYHFAG